VELRESSEVKEEIHIGFPAFFPSGSSGGSQFGGGPLGLLRY
jgi:hypothetical protein